MFVDRAFTEHNHIETFCIRCGSRRYYHNEDMKYGEGARLWLLEKMVAKASICQ
jgi:hypothetical protein